MREGVRYDKFEPGDRVEWDQDFVASHSPGIIARHGPGPFLISEVIEVKPESWRMVEHTQQVKIGPDKIVSGAWFRVVRPATKPLATP